MQELLPLVAQQKFATTNIVLGLAIVENAYDQTMLIEAIKPDKIIQVASQICTETRPIPATSAPGLGSPLPHLHRGLGSPPPHLHMDWVRTVGNGYFARDLTLARASTLFHLPECTQE